MILAEVKRNDGDKFQWRLFMCSFPQFHKMANKRYVAIGRAVHLDVDEIIKRLVWTTFHEEV